jgi:Zn-dependent peptidase ImmA (M78 family)/DNA-binding XRE family transcriptional regulator
MKPGTPGFVGDKLKEAREARELSVAALADLLGLTRQSIYQYEGGAQSPSPEVMRRLSEILRLPYHFFSDSQDFDEPGVLFYRSLESTAQLTRLKSERRYAWLNRLACYLRGMVKFPPVNFPRFDLPTDPRQLSEARVEEAAEETRRFWSLSNNSISNITWLVENHGAVVSLHDLGSDKLDAFSHWCDADGTPYFVLGSDKRSAVRSRYNVAHELGHMILHRGIPKETFNTKAIFKLVEDQAHRFAGAFLLPEETFSLEFRSTPNLYDFLAIKPRWKVSIQFMIMRCDQLGIISEDQKSSLFTKLTAKKWRMKEPLDDQIETESPRLLRRSIELLIGRRAVAPNEIPFRLRLDESDVEQLAGLPAGFFSQKAMESPGMLRMATQSTPDDEPSDYGIIRFPGSGAS